MWTWLPTISDLLSRQLPTFLVLLGLGGVGWWGARHEWKLKPMLLLDHLEKKAEREKKPEPALENGAGPINLPAQAATKAGFEVGEAKARPVTQQVTASAVLAFDQTR